MDDISEQELRERLLTWLDSEEILIERYRKKGRRKVLVTENVVDLMKEVELQSFTDKDSYIKVVLSAVLKIGESGTLRPRDFVDAFIRDMDLQVDEASISFKRTGQRI